MNIDSNTVTIIIAVIALISPIATAWLNNHYQTKRENIQNYELAKRQALIDFIKCANDYHQHKTSSRTAEYNSSLSNLYIYFSNIPKEIHNLENTNYNEFDKELNSIIVKLSSQVTKK